MSITERDIADYLAETQSEKPFHMDFATDFNHETGPSMREIRNKIDAIMAEDKKDVELATTMLKHAAGYGYVPPLVDWAIRWSVRFEDWRVRTGKWIQGCLIKLKLRQPPKKKVNKTLVDLGFDQETP